MPSEFKLPTATRPATFAAELPNTNTATLEDTPPRSDRHKEHTRHGSGRFRTSRAQTATAATRTQRPHTATFHAHHGHNVRGPHCRTHGTKKPPRGRCRWGLLFYSVTSFTISSAVFPSAAFRNFAFASPRFISGILVSISSTIRPIRLSIVFSLSNAAKQ